jgi:cold-inducible RNA-binding protein
MAVRLFVGNLPYNTTEAELREHLSTVSPPSSVYLPTDRESGKPRGFAFVEFNDRAQAEEAIRRFNNQMFKGRPITINEARAREDRPRTGAPPSRPFSPRPFTSRPDAAPSPGLGEPSVGGEKPSRNFGPDAIPRRKTKAKGGSKSERAPKGPMREVVRGQFFGGEEDDNLDDDLNDENFASRAEDEEDDYQDEEKD